LPDRPTIADIYDARRRIEGHITRTPLRNYPSLDEIVGAEVWVKHENFQTLGAFKVRGGLNLLSRIDPELIANGVIGASSGNHGQSIAYAAKIHNTSCVIVVPVGANPGKVRSMQNLGAEVIFQGEYYDQSRDAANAIAEERCLYYIDAANEPDLIAGVATYSLEIFEDLSDIDTVFVPVGAGSGASGACIVADALSPSTRVIGVQAAAAPAAQLSWKAGEMVEAEMKTAAEGLATAHAYEMPQAILRDLLEDFVLVSEDDIEDAVSDYLDHTHSLVEGAGAVALAGAKDQRDRIKRQRVVVIASGANLSRADLKKIVSEREG
jgi:threonine dehydratase